MKDNHEGHEVHEGFFCNSFMSFMVKIAVLSCPKSREINPKGLV